MNARRHHATVLVWTLLAGCGRFGFDEGASVDATTPIDSPAPLVPLHMHLGTFSTVSQTFADVFAPPLVIPPSAGKRWLIVLAGAIGSTVPADVTVEARYLVDGVERGIGATQNSRALAPGPWQHVYVLDGTTKAQSITIQIRHAQGGTSAFDGFDLVAIPLDPADVAYASHDDVIDVVSLTRVRLHRFRLAHCMAITSS